MAALFDLAKNWENVPDADRQPLRDLVKKLVRYSCKIACQENDGIVDIYVFNEKKRQVCDWLEIQPTGAIGVLFDEYPEPESSAINRLDDACEAYNEKIGAVFEEEEEEESEEEEEETEEESEEKPDTQ
jgi:hypothetical protein